MRETLARWPLTGHVATRGPIPPSTARFWRICPCPTPSRSASSRFPPRRRAFWWCSATTTLKFGAATREGARAGGRTWSSARRRPTSSRARAASTLDILAPEGLKAARLIVVGTGKAADLKEKDFLKLGGVDRRQARRRERRGHDHRRTARRRDERRCRPPRSASGIRLRAYNFDRYKTKKKDDDDDAVRADVSIAVADVAAARRRPSRRERTSPTA